MSKKMNDTRDAEDEMEQRQRAHSSDQGLCSDTKMMQDQTGKPGPARKY